MKSTQDEKSPVENEELANIALVDHFELVVESVRFCAEAFFQAERDGDVAAAQDAWMMALTYFAGLFPDPSDPVHHLLTTALAMSIDIREGVGTGKQFQRTIPNILLRSSPTGEGWKKGYFHNEHVAFMLAAAEIALEAGIYKNETAANKGIAQMMADLGYSLQNDEHGQPRPISSSAIYRWKIEMHDRPVIRAIVVKTKQIHTTNLSNRGAWGADDIYKYLKEKAADLVGAWKNWNQ